MNISKKISYYSITLLVWIILFWGAGELLIRIIYPQIQNYNLEMWRYAKDLKQAIPDADLPFHHYPNREGTYYGVPIFTNNMGFRGKEVLLGKAPEKKRILFVGDSFTLGWGVPFDSTYAQQLANQLEGQPYEVINLGIGNYNSIMEEALFQKKGLPLTPDVVVLMFFVNDTEPTPTRSALEKSILGKSYFLAFLFDRYHKIKVMTNKNYNWTTYYQGLYTSENKGLAPNRVALRQLAASCKSKGIKLLVCNIPELHQLQNYPFPMATEYIQTFANEQGLPFLDLLPYLEKEEPARLWVSKEDQHANAYANTIIARAIFKKLLEINYID